MFNFTFSFRPARCKFSHLVRFYMLNRYTKPLMIIIPRPKCKLSFGQNESLCLREASCSCWLWGNFTRQSRLWTHDSQLHLFFLSIILLAMNNYRHPLVSYDIVKTQKRAEGFFHLFMWWIFHRWPLAVVVYPQMFDWRNCYRCSTAPPSPPATKQSSNWPC